MGIALIICTRNRPNILSRTLSSNIHGQTLMPGLVVVVDSSDDHILKINAGTCSNAAQLTGCQIVHISSQSGLPYQRNVGIRYIATHHNLEFDLLAFADDDVLIGSEFLSESVQLLLEYPVASGVGAFQQDSAKVLGVKVLQLLGLMNRSPGTLSRSVLLTPPHFKPYTYLADFTPGGLMLFRSALFESALFDGKLRMFGEDIEFQLRALQPRSICIGTRTSFVHLEATRGKIGTLKTMMSTVAVRWNLAKSYPSRLSVACVIGSSLLIGISYAITGIVTLNKKRIMEALGCLFGLFLCVCLPHRASLIDHLDREEIP